MANASEKLKALGLRHGEKAVVGLSGLIFLGLVGMAISTPTIQMKPEELKTKAEAAQSNLAKKQDFEAIATRVQEAGIVDPGFAKIVATMESSALKPENYRERLSWVTPEPGAGLIRDQPELIAPTELAAYPGRGGVLLYTLNDKGERILDAKAMAAGNTSGEMGRPGASRPPSGAAAPSDDAKKAQERELKRLQQSLAGKAAPATEKAATKDEEAPKPEDVGPWVQEPQGKRWVVITGVVDNELMNKNWLLAVKNPALAYPKYYEPIAERQVKQDDGTWSEWQADDRKATYAVIENMPEEAPEIVPEMIRTSALVDPLPVLVAGYWTGVHVARLVPADILKGPQVDAGMANMGMPGGRPGGMGMSSNSGMGMGRPGMGAMSPGGRPGGMGMSSNSGMGKGSGMSMDGEMGASGGMGSGGVTEPGEAVVPNPEPTIMVRYFDFDVKPNTTYRYRLRLAAANPNYNHTDVNPGVDTSSKSLKGPWSKETEAVTVPSDVAIYAQNPEPSARRDDLVKFDVVRWDPAKGQTVIRSDEAGPGQIVGEYATTPMPSTEGKGPTSENVDFNSRSIVLDTSGGRSRMPDVGLDRNQYTVPAVAMVVEPDGAVVVRNQADDQSNVVRKDMFSNYKQALEDSNTAKDSNKGNTYGMPGSSSRSGGPGMGGVN